MLPRLLALALTGTVVLVVQWGGGSLAATALAQPADPNTEARAFFEEGNRYYERAQRLRASARERALELAVASYVASLQIVRSRNVLFNAALVLAELDRYDEAFAFFTEYLAVPDLSDDERAEGLRRRAELREHIAIVSIRSEPSGAAVFLDRLDLAARGATPIELAVSPGRHDVFLSLPHHDDSMVPVDAAVGTEAELAIELRPLPVSVLIETPDGGEPAINGQAIRAGEAREILPGRHRFSLDLSGRPPIEREIEIQPGGDPVTVVLGRPVGESARLVLHANVPARFRIGGALRAEGESVELSLTPGFQELSIEADGFETVAQRVELRAGVTTELAFELDRLAPTRRFGRTPVWLGVGTSFLAAATIGVAIRSTVLRRRYNALVVDSDSALQDGISLADRIDRLTISWNALLAATAVGAIATFVFARINHPVVDLAVMPMPGGASLAAHWEFPQ